MASARQAWTVRPKTGAATESAETGIVSLARRALISRRALSEALPAGIVCDHGLELLLMLFLAQADGRALDEAALLADVCIPPEPARRWVAALIAAALAERADGRITLTPGGSAAVAAAMARARDAIHGPTLLP